MSEINHVAMIMDGNRRWAKKRGQPSIFGHKQGYKRFVEIGEICRQKGIDTLTVYAFSTENWKRDKKEVGALMDLLRVALEKEGERLHKDNIKVKIIGRITDLSEDLQKSIAEIEKKTVNNTAGNLNIAISYGGQAEIVDAVKKIVASGAQPEDVDEELIESNLYTEGQENPQLIIRCGGQKRLSNFLLWQSAYSEIYFTDVLWPDFDENELNKALDFYKNIKRNFGK